MADPMLRVDRAMVGALEVAAAAGIPEYALTIMARMPTCCVCGGAGSCIVCVAGCQRPEGEPTCPGCPAG